MDAERMRAAQMNVQGDTNAPEQDATFVQANALTRRQAQILRFIREYLDAFGYAPSVREIAERLRITSTNGVNDHLLALERKGWVERTPRTARGLRLLRRDIESAERQSYGNTKEREAGRLPARIAETDSRPWSPRLVSVYFARASATGAIKIGSSNDIVERIRGLQTAQSGAIELLAQAPGSKAYERLLHVRFDHLRLRGEWFLPEPELISFIERVPACTTRESFWSLIVGERQ